MPNESKIKDPRMWARWRASGAVGTAKKVQPVDRVIAGGRYSNMGALTALGFLVNALDKGRGGDGDTGASFPRSDAEDLSRGGVRFIPGEVTLARREGKKVNFVTACGPCCWHWEMPDGSKIYHWDPIIYDQIGAANGRKKVSDKYGTHFENGAGHCPHCGNPYTNGDVVGKIIGKTKKEVSNASHERSSN